MQKRTGDFVLPQEALKDKSNIVISPAGLWLFLHWQKLSQLPSCYAKLEALADAVREWKKAHEKANDMSDIGSIKWQESWLALGDAVEKVGDALEELDDG